MSASAPGRRRSSRRQALARGAGVALSLFAYCAIGAAPAQDDSESSPRQLIERLRGGGLILYLRHAATDLSSRDQGSKGIDDCTRQRNLSSAGRAQALVIGAAFAGFGIPVGDVYSSPYCRCKDTAELAFGRYTVVDDLQFSISKDRVESNRLGKRLREMMLAAPTDGGNTVFVGHTANLRDAVGFWPQPEGVTVVFERVDGEIRPLGTIGPDRWPAVAE